MRFRKVYFDLLIDRFDLIHQSSPRTNYRYRSSGSYVTKVDVAVKLRYVLT